MNQTDLEIFEMYFVDGMKEAEIAKSLGLSEEAVHEVLAAMEADGASGDEYEQTLDR